MTGEPLSLLDAAGMKVTEWHVVYHDRIPYRWFFKYLKPGYRHVELARPIYYGPGVNDVAWLHVLPMMEMFDVELSTDPRPPWVRCPNSIVQKVTAMRPLASVRSWFDIGPMTCVEAAKWALGVRAFWVRTPWQLFKFIQKRNGVLVSGRRRRQQWPDVAGTAASDRTSVDECEPESSGECAT